MPTKKVMIPLDQHSRILISRSRIYLEQLYPTGWFLESEKKMSKGQLRRIIEKLLALLPEEQRREIVRSNL